MSRILVVGSGATGVHFGLTALERGHEVTMLDVGHARPPSVAPAATFDQLKDVLDDPVGYFLGARGEGVVYPASKPSYYGHPPSKEHVFRVPQSFAVRSIAMQPLFSFARGGLAEAWTAGSYAFNDTDLAPFGLTHAELAPYYRTVAQRIGIGGVRDDLARFIPYDDAYLEPLRPDPHSAHLLDRYAARRTILNQRWGFFLGRSRVAVLSRDHGGRPACTQLGRCLWGCPTDAIYSPFATLRDCLTHPRFRYVPGVLVSHFEYNSNGWVTRVVGSAPDGSSETCWSADWFALAAGALATSKIMLDSAFRATGRTPVLPGLMDNRQIHVPFLTPAMTGQPVETASYQFHHLAFGVDRPNAEEYVHGQITTLRAAAVHPIVQSLPCDLGTALRIFRATRAGLGIANVNLHDRRRQQSHLTIRPLPEGHRTELVIQYADDPGEPARLIAAVRAVKAALRELGCLVPPGLTRVLPKGASAHYSGTLPISPTPTEFGCAPNGRSHHYQNLWVVDGATFPFLPAKNLTFTLMANAVRVAETVSQER